MLASSSQTRHFPRGLVRVPGAALAAWFCLPLLSLAHPVPDIPVRTLFDGGKAEITVMIDVRCFAEDAENEPYLQHWVLEEMSEEEREELKAKAGALLEETVRFILAPGKRVVPEFAFTFTGRDGEELEGVEDPVMIWGSAKIDVPEGSTGYRIEADERGKFSVVFLNQVDGKEVERINVLFPGEKSYVLDLAGTR